MIKRCLILAASISSMAGAALVAFSADQQGSSKYQVVANWPKVPADIQLKGIVAVAVDAADQVYVLDRDNRLIFVFDKQGNFLRSFGQGLFKYPHGMRIDRDGNIWIADIGDHLVTKLTLEGKVLMTLGKKDQPGKGDDQFNKPADVAVARTGEIYVADGYGNSRVMKFSKEGKFLKSWGKKGKGPGEFNLPHAICFDDKGRIYVGDRENKRVQIFDTDGKFLEQWKSSGAPFGLLWVGGRLFVADGYRNQIQIMDGAGKVLGSWGEKGTNPGQFRRAHWVATDSSGVIYVAEIEGQRVQKFVAK